MKKKQLVWHGRFTPWLFLLPTLVGLISFRLIPIVWAVVLSFTQWSLLGSPRFIGIANYIEAFHTDNFIQILTNTSGFSIIYVIGSMVFGLFLALLINLKIRSIAFFRALIYLPVITSAVAVGIVWKWILGPNIGLLNSILQTLNLPAPYWLGNPRLALATVASVQVWKMAGYYMILFLAGLQGIPSETIEAATVDGASKIQILRKITLPMLSPTIFFVLTIAIIDSFKNFELIYAMTKGGPQNSTNTLVYDVYLNAFVYYRVGYASSVAFVLLVFVGILTMLNFYIKRNWAQPLQ